MLTNSVILFSTQQEVMRYRKACAAASDLASLGVRVSTPQALISELWDVWGSDEQLITARQRLMIVAKLLNGQDAWVASTGTAKLLASFLADYLCYVEDDFIVAHEQDFNTTDRQIITFIKNYLLSLERHGLIEPCLACAQMKESVRLERVVCRTQSELPPYLKDFLVRAVDSLECQESQISVSETKNDEKIDQSVLFLKPSGGTASAVMILDQIAHARSGSVLLAAPDPLRLFRTLKDALVSAGSSIELDASYPFRATKFGRAFCALSRLAKGEESESIEGCKALVAAYLESPFSQVFRAKGQQIIENLRSDRTTQIADVRIKLNECSRSYEYFEELLTDTDADILLDYFEELALSMRLSASDLDLELAAISTLRLLYADARLLAVSPSYFLNLVEELTVPYRVAVKPASIDGKGREKIGPSVLITDLARAAAWPERSFDQVILSSLDASHYSGASTTNTLTEFALRFGLPAEDTSLIDLENRFHRACRVARRSLVFEYANQNINGEERYPAFFLEEFLNSRNLEGDPVLVLSCGEEDFSATARLAELPESRTLSEVPSERGQISRANFDLRYEKDANGELVPVISPSSIERYRNCPYRWFVERKMNIEDVDEEFGPLQIGTFVHKVYQTLFDRLATRGITRVEVNNREVIARFFDEVFDELIEGERDLEAGSRLVWTSQLELEEIKHLKRQMLNALLLQDSLFPGYHVKAHEVVLSPEEKIPYGGAYIQGRIDRIDLDRENNFIIVDYKGSLVAHAAGYADDDQPFEAPDKVQALIYAQALRRKDTALVPKGAVYLSYKAKTPKDLIRGSLSESLDDSLELTTKSSVVEGNFEVFLDNVESDLSKTIAQMKSGDIAPCPRTICSCRNCPVLYCESRIDES